MAQMVLPRVQAMVLCDGVEESEHEGGVYHLTGVRTALESPFPAVVSQLCVFLHMSGHQGESTFQVEVEHVDSGDVIAESLVQAISFESPAHAVSALVVLEDCVFPAPGVYYVQLFHEAKLIG